MRGYSVAFRRSEAKKFAPLNLFFAVFSPLSEYFPLLSTPKDWGEGGLEAVLVMLELFRFGVNGRGTYSSATPQEEGEGTTV